MTLQLVGDDPDAKALFSGCCRCSFSQSQALAADLRCQGDLMTPGTIITKVRHKCGEPLWEDRIGEVKRHHATAVSACSTLPS
jgi:hypothetical protein